MKDAMLLERLKLHKYREVLDAHNFNIRIVIQEYDIMSLILYYYLNS